MTNNELKFWAFLCHARQDNCETRPDTPEVAGLCWGNWLREALKTFSIPAEFVGQVNSRGEIIPTQIDPIFQDESDPPGDAGLSGESRRALEQSRCLIVICSPRSAKCPRINEAVRHFKQLGRANHILPFVITGEPNAADGGKPGVSPDDECFVPAMRHALRPDGSLDVTRPAGRYIIVDARLGVEKREILAKDLQSAEPNLEIAKLQLIAGLIGVWFGALWRREQKRRFVGFAEAQHQAREAVKQVEEARRQAREAQDKVLEMQNLPRDVQGQIQEAQQTAFEARNQASEAQKQLQEFQIKVRDTQAQLEEACARALAAEKKFLEAQNQARESERQAGEILRQLREAQSQAEAAPEQIQEARRQAGDARQQLQEAQDQARQAREQLEESQSRSRESQTQLDEARSRALAAECKLLEVQNQAQELERQAVETRRLLEEARSQAQIAPDQIQEVRRQAGDTGHQLQEAQDHARQAREQLEESQSKARDSQTQLDEARSRALAAENKLLEAQNQARESERQAVESRRLLEEARSQAKMAPDQTHEIQAKTQRARRLSTIYAILAVLALLSAGIAAGIAWRQRTAASQAMARVAAEGVWEPDLTRGKMDQDQIRQALLVIGGPDQAGNRPRSLAKLAAWIPRDEIPDALKASSVILDDRQRTRFQVLLLLRLGWANPLSAMTCAAGIDGRIVNDNGVNDSNVCLQLAVLDDWMKTDLPGAFNWVAQLPDADSRQRALEKIVPPLAAADPSNALAKLDDLKPVPAEPVYTLLFQRWATHDPVQAIQQWQQLPGHENDGNALCAIITAWVAQQPDAALNWLQSQPDSAARIQALETCVGQLANTNTLPDQMQSAVAAWAESDPAAVAKWLENLPAGTNTEGLVGSFLQGAAAKSPEFAGQWTASITNDARRQQCQLQVARQWMKSDPASASNWLQRLDLPEEFKQLK